jgi:hypothetical protein
MLCGIQGLFQKMESVKLHHEKEGGLRGWIVMIVTEKVRLNEIVIVQDVMAQGKFRGIKTVVFVMEMGLNKNLVHVQYVMAGEVV